MLTTFRRMSKSWFAAIIIGLLIIGLAVVGMFDPMQFDFSSHVVKAGDREVSQPQFRQIIDNLNERNAEMTGQRFTMTELVESGQHMQILEGLAGEESLFAWVWRVGLRPARELVAAQIREIPGFFDPVTGQFSEQAMAQALAEAGMTPADFEDTVRHQIAAEHFVSGAAGLRFPRVYGAVAATFAGETRDGRWMLLSPSDIRDVPAPTDEQLNALLTELADQVREPERRTVTIVRFTPAAAAQGIEISDQAIQDRFNFQRDSLGTPETRSFVTLTATSAQAGRAIAERLRAGEEAADVASSLGIEPVSYDGQPRSAVPDARVAQAAFGLQAGGVSDPVESELGGHVVIQLTGVSEGRPATLEAHREEIEAALRMEQARVRVTEMVEQFVSLREGGTSMREAGVEAGGIVQTLPPFTADGMMQNGQPMGAPEVLYETAFATAQGADSDIVDAGQDEYFAVHVEEVVEARMPTLDDLRPQLIRFWTMREVGRRLQERGNAIAERVRGGEDIAEVARAEGLRLVSREGLGRGDAEGENPVGQGVLEGLFGRNTGEVLSGPADQEGRFVIGEVGEISPPAAVLAGRQAEQVRPRLTGEAFQSELIPAIQAAARTEVETRVYPDRARAALGVPPEEAPAEGGSAE